MASSESPLLIPNIVYESEAVQDILKNSVEIRPRKRINWGQSLLSLGKSLLVPDRFTIFRKRMEDPDASLFENKDYIDLVDELKKGIYEGTYKSSYNFIDLLSLTSDLAFDTDFTTKLENTIAKWPEDSRPETLFGDVTSILTEYAVPAGVATKILKGVSQIPKVKKTIDKIQEVEEKLLPLPKFTFKTPIKKIPVVTVGGPGLITNVARRVGYGGALLGLTDAIGSGPEAFAPFWSKLEDTKNLSGREKAIAEFKNRLRYGKEGTTIGAGFGLLGKPLALGFKYGLYTAIDVGGLGARTAQRVINPITKVVARTPGLPTVAKTARATGSFIGKDIATRLAVGVTNPKLLLRKIPPLKEWKKFTYMSEDPLQVKLKKLDDKLNFFRSVGVLTSNVAQVSQGALALLRSQQKTVETLQNDLNKTAYNLAKDLRKIYDRKGLKDFAPTTERLFKQYLDFLEDYILGQRPLQDLPEAMRNSSQSLKNKLEDIHKNFKDVLDKDELLKDGAQTFKDVYRRTFAIFTNENWAPRLGDETFDNMKDFMKGVISKNKDLIDDANKAYPNAKDPVEEFAVQRTYDMLHTAKQGGKDPLDVLQGFAGKSWLRISDEKNFVKTGEELPDVVKKFLGQERDVRTSVLTTAADLISFTSMRRVYDEVADRALKDGLLFETKQQAINIGRIPLDRLAVMAEDALSTKGSSVLGKARGLYGDKQVVAALMGQSRFDASNFFKFYQNILLWKSAAQYGKTVLSPATQVRNVTSAGLFAVANGHIGGGNLLQNLNLVLNDIFGAGKGLDIAQLTRITERATELRVLDENLVTAEITGVLRDIRKGKIINEEGLFDTLTNAQWVRKAGKTAEKLYAGGDNLWKLNGWFYEMSRLKNIINVKDKDAVRRWFKEITGDDFVETNYKTGQLKTDDEIIEEMAAWYVTNLYPTYSKIPDVIKAIRLLPLGNFVAFPAEMMRTSVNIMQTALREISSSNPEIRNMGIQRLLGLTTIFGAAEYGASKLSETLSGLSDEEVAVYKNFFSAPWEVNSKLAFMTPLRDGKAKVLNLSYFNPYSVISDTARSLFNNVLAPIGAKVGITKDPRRNPDEAILDSIFSPEGPLSQLLSPFISEPIGAEPFLDIIVRGGKTREGVSIWGPRDKLTEKFVKSFQHILKSVEPGASRTARLITNAATGDVRKDNRPYNLQDELLALFAGVRLSDIDVLKSFKFSIRDFKDIRGDVFVSERFYSLDNYTTKTPDFRAKEFEQIQEEAFRSQKEFYNTIQAALHLGIPEDEIRDTLKSVGVPRKDINLIMSGTFKPVGYQKNRLRSAYDDFKKQNPNQAWAESYFVPIDELEDVLDKYKNKRFEEFNANDYLEKMKERIEQTFEEAARSQDLDSSAREIPTPPLPEQPDPSVAATTKVVSVTNPLSSLTNLSQAQLSLLSPGEQAIAQRINRRV